MKTTLLTFATLAAAFLLTSCGETQKLTPDQALASSKVLPAPDFGRDDAQPAVQAYQYRESFKASDSEEAQSQEYRVELSQPEGIAPHEFVITGLAEIANLHATASMTSDTEFEIYRTELEVEGVEGTVTISGSGQRYEGKFFLSYQLTQSDRTVTAEGWAEIQ